ncbi:hypothetical protein H696_02205 [Fonticula alba]|uniref:Exoribonuclease phosphorolytic domain-containing protein n=1 Tax=Fonticula alba TaxID=691883 RepID=A0A058ZAD5_FONAL|nr:hypothetical protein H696_02205 [Fonticula alba]KCV71255.1 hypothetical protein H696_02205 [Fonticula alba]|eukprot:XP_009494378.1 hypothetical protein H696_02205 [Fonticula alba]
MFASREFVSPEGLRLDGRRVNELRRLRVRSGPLTDADGSSYLELGNTRVLVAVYGPREVSSAKAARQTTQSSDRATVCCQFSMATFSGGERRRKIKGDRRTMSHASALEKAFSSTIAIDKIPPRSQIDIFVEVLQSDGGMLVACINATTLALIDAGIEIRDYLCASSSALLNDITVIDPNQNEEQSFGGSPTATVAVLPVTGGVVYLDVDTRLHIDRLEELVNQATTGALTIHTLLEKVVRDRTQSTVSTTSAQQNA